jgi:hypothetical protein
MHDPAAYALNGTRVICNPRGYPGELVTGRFDPTLCVNVWVVPAERTVRFTGSTRENHVSGAA